MLVVVMLMMIAHLAAAADAAVLGALAGHTPLRCNLADINIALARRTRRHFDKSTTSASATECLRQQLSAMKRRCERNLLRFSDFFSNFRDFLKIRNAT